VKRGRYFPDARLWAGAHFPVHSSRWTRSRRIAKRGPFYRGRPVSYSSCKACTGFALVARSAGMSIATIDDKISNRETPK